MSRLKGADYHHQLVTEGEVQNKLDDLKTGMMMAYNYAQGEAPLQIVVFKFPIQIK